MNDQTCLLLSAEYIYLYNNLVSYNHTSNHLRSDLVILLFQDTDSETKPETLVTESVDRSADQKSVLLYSVVP